VTTPAVSVIIPCYNGGRFLPAALQSLAAQTFRDFETVIVDDGSTDPETQDLLARLGPEVRVVRQENRGLPGARNTGFREARAALVLPFDCDDVLSPTLLEEAVPLLQSAPADVAFVTCHEQLTGAREDYIAISFDPFSQLFHNQLHYCLLLRKSIWQEVGGYDDSMRNGYEDWEFNIRLIGAGYRGLVIPKPLFNYRVSGDGMLMSHSGRMHATLWRRIYARHARLYRWDWLAAHNGKRNPLRRFVRNAAAAMFLLVYRNAPESVLNRGHRLWLLAKRNGWIPWQVDIN
jgi:glycosyltransferase involved in cell wall biosynthesis